MRLCVIGIGNEQRRDDGVGVWVAQQIAAAAWPGVLAVPLGAGDSTFLLSAWQTAPAACLIDAVNNRARPGTVLRFDALKGGLRDNTSTFSSHGLGVAQAVELGRALGMLPERLIIYGIVGRDFDYGAGLSPEVEVAGKKVIERVRRLARRLAAE